MKKPDHWMPFDVRKYLGDTMHLSREQHGAYLLLLMAYWMRGGPLNDSDAELGAIVRASQPDWRRLRPVLEMFFSSVDGKWVQKRAEEELHKARAMIEKKSDAGKKGAERRWQSDGTDNGKADGTRMAEAQQKVCQTDAPLPSPLPSQKKELAARMARFEEFWGACPKKTGRGEAEKAWPRACKLAEPDVLIAAMRQYAVLQSGKDKTFTKTPAPWLNGKHWLDEDVGTSGATIHVLSDEVRQKEQENLKKMGFI